MNDHDTSAPVQLSETDAITLAFGPYTRPCYTRAKLGSLSSGGRGCLRPHPGGGPREPKSRAGPDSRLARDLAKNGETLRDRDCASDGRARRGRLAST